MIGKENAEIGSKMAFINVHDALKPLDIFFSLNQADTTAKNKILTDLIKYDCKEWLKYRQAKFHSNLEESFKMMYAFHCVFQLVNHLVALPMQQPACKSDMDNLPKILPFARNYKNGRLDIKSESVILCYEKIFIA